MGVRADGVHVFGVLSPVRARNGDEQIMVVEAVGWSSYIDEQGAHLVLSDAEGNIVERFAPGEWEDVRREVPGVDAEEA